MVRLGIFAFLVAAASAVASVELAAHSAPVARVPAGSSSAPVLGESVLVAPVRGKVLVRPPGEGQFTELTGPLLIPVGSELDTTEGEAELTSALPGGASQSGSFRDGRFRVLQQVDAGGLTELELTGGDFATVCSDSGAGRRKPFYVIGEGGASVRRLWGSAKGKFRTRGRYSSTTVRGTVWLTDDRCGGTLTQVDEGSATVSDFARGEEIELEGGESYLAELFGWGYVSAIAVDSATPGTLYIAGGSLVPPGEGTVFKSTNAGDTWMPVAEFSATLLAIDPRTPDTVYAGGYDGLFKSTDGGRSWKRATIVLQSEWSELAEWVIGLAIAPGEPQTLYAATVGGFYKSVDGGRRWNAADAGLKDQNVTQIAIDPRTPDTVYAGGYDGVFKTTDGGRSWKAIGFDQVSVLALEIDPEQPDTVYISADRPWKSDDGGVTWTSLTGPGPLVFDFAFDPRTSRTIYVGTSFGIFKTRDAGATWEDASLGTQVVFAVAVDPGLPDTVYAGTQRGFYVSSNGGAGWRAANAGLTITDVSALAIALPAPRTIYAGTSIGGADVFRSDDGGGSWAAVPTGLGWAYALVVDPRTALTVYVATPLGVRKTTDGGLSWNTASVGLPRGEVAAVAALAIDPKSPGTLYAGTFNGVFKTVNGGATWRRMSQGLRPAPGFSPPTFFVRDLVVHPRSPRTIYAAVSGDVYRSRDGGEHWTVAQEGLPGNRTVAIAIDAGKPGTVYAGTWSPRGRSWSNCVYVSVDGGRRWSRAEKCLPGRGTDLTALVADPVAGSMLYAGVSTGVYRSADGGRGWRRLARGHVRALAVDPRGTVLYAGTNRGVLIIRLR